MKTIPKAVIAEQKGALWPRALKWLLFLGPLFFISYGSVNTFTATRADVGEFVFAWEQHIPFWEWSIVPYMSIDLLYAISLFICSTKKELDRHGIRLLLATIVSVICFLLFPLQFTLVRPETSGFYGALFDLLTSFDKPFNQAPSLHISLLVLIWLVFNQHIQPVFLRWLMHGWMMLIGISVLTTWQHHFIDVLGGLAVALVLIYLIPNGTEQWRWYKHQDIKRWCLARRYALAAVFLGLVATGFSTWVLLWPALSLVLVALAYAGLGGAIFQHEGKRMTVAAWLLLAPYLAAARISAYWFSRKRSDQVEVVKNIWLGSRPSSIRKNAASAILNVTAEIDARIPQTEYYRRVPMLDLVAPNLLRFEQAVMALNSLARGNQTVLVHCALGLSRSALVVAGWLLLTAQAKNVDEAIAKVKLVRPDCVISQAQRTVLSEFAVKHVGGENG